MDLTGAEMIVAERVRQLKKGYTTQHDLDEHECGEPESSPLLNDAMTLVGDVFNGQEDSSAMMACAYPFGASAVDKLTMAGALIAAQIDAIKASDVNGAWPELPAEAVASAALAEDGGAYTAREPRQPDA